ncbi:MAG: hypothetical protein QOD77_1392 [Thermoplasmata archaeon]|jgi:hypothetical protein|nr:hypothetical protein [Thermoplasmata archaeon]
MRSRAFSCGLAALLAIALGPAAAAPAGYGTSYWEDATVKADARIMTALGPRDGREECQPIEGTGEEPGLVVYPVLNMYTINQCSVGAPVGMLEGPVVLAGGLGHGRGMPSNVTITSDDGDSWTAVAVACSPPAGAIDPPSVNVYAVLSSYALDACSLVPGASWDTFTVVLDLSLEALG